MKLSKHNSIARILHFFIKMKAIKSNDDFRRRDARMADWLDHVMAELDMIHDN